MNDKLVKLNLGCSDRLRGDGFTNVDRCEPADLVVDLEQLPWPWETSSVDEIVADDILEHIWPTTDSSVVEGVSLHLKRQPVKYPIIALMNEIWRVLKPGGVIHIFIPTTDGRGAWQDPTHVTFWSRNTFFYFTDGVPERERFGKSYGIEARFKVTGEVQNQYPNEVSKLTISLQAVK